MAITAGDYLIRPVLKASSGLPEDDCVNDWAIKKRAGAPSPAELLIAMGIVGEFYRGVNLNLATVGTYISSAITRAATHRIDAYKIQPQGTPIGSPVSSMAWLGPTTEGSPAGLPREVCGVLSFHGDQLSVQEELGNTRPRARRRGRVYIGPLTTQAITQAGAPVLEPTFTSAMRTKAIAMQDALDIEGWDWCVWSRADDTLYPVVAGWTDNAPDTQRRRGQAPTLRVVYTV